MMRQFYRLFLLSAIVFSSMGAIAQTVVFEDDFSADSSGSYSHFYFPEEKNVLVDYQYDYSRILNGFGLEIPASPRTAGADMAALMVSCNILEAPDNINSFVGVYTNQVFGGDYQVIFDFYCNLMDSGSGTTNRMSVGINHSGEKRVNTYGAGYDPAGGFTKEDLLDTDGYMFAMSFDEGDGGSFRDYQFTEGTPGVSDILLGVTQGDEAQETAAVLPDYAPRWFAMDVNEETGEPISLVGWQGADHRSLEPVDVYRSPTAAAGSLFSLLFSDEYGNPPAVFKGAPALAWHTMRIDYIDGVASVWIQSDTIDEFAIEDAEEYFPWLVYDEEGFVKAVEYDDPDDTYSSGKIYFGMEDVWSSAWGAPTNPDAPRLQFVLYDNIQVIQIGDPYVPVEHWSVY